jgi:hypothetical protein
LICKLENNAKINDKAIVAHIAIINKAGGFGYPILTMNDFALPFRKAIGSIKKIDKQSHCK